MAYTVKEIHYTLQGEGARTGRAAVFCRFAGCNLWSGLERDRDTAQCRFCDTDFIGTDGPGGGRFATADDLANKIVDYWPQDGNGKPYVVFTGGEPLLQLDTALTEALHGLGFEIAVETNGTQPAPQGIDWICVSPKAGTEQVLTTGQELKLVYPQDGLDPAKLETQAFENFFVQPMAGATYHESLAACLDLCRSRPHWRLSLQTHKLLGIP